MVWSVQNDRPATGRDSARKDRRSQDCESERGRESESLVQVQYPGDPGSTLFQERPATGSGHRGCQQEGSAQSPRSAGVRTFRARENSSDAALRRPVAQRADGYLSRAPGGGRTHNLWLRRPTLYPVELRARMGIGISHRFRRFSQRISVHPRARNRRRARIRIRILDDDQDREFRLQNRCLRMRVCARSSVGWHDFMNRIIDVIEKEQQKGDLRPFSVGGSVRVHTRVVEGDKERIQIFTGVVIGRKGRGLNETFTVRRISYGEGVERVFPLHSPRIAKVEVEQQGRVRRARLNYLRTRKGKEATAVRE